MRLINADNLHYIRKWFVDSGKSEVVVFAKEIDKAPTVEAIPIEWIKMFLDLNYPIESPYGTKAYFHDFMERMIKEWRRR